MSDPTSKNKEPIQKGDTVSTAFRGGKREGEVCSSFPRILDDGLLIRHVVAKVQKVVTTDEEAKEEGVKNPPKVLFEDQHGHRVAHNPETLTKK